MKKILIIGATGQLGTSVFTKLAHLNRYSLRILVREDSKYEHLQACAPEIVFGDLTDRASLQPAVRGSDVVITTANTMAPRKKSDTLRSVDIHGYRNLIDLAKENPVQQFIYTSAYFRPEWGRGNAFVAAKAATEDYLRASGLIYTIFQPDAFMDIHFAFMGTTIPLTNEVAPTVNRHYPFMQNFYNSVKDDVAKGKIGIVGNGRAKHSYIAIDNVADFLVGSIGNQDLYNQTLPVGGPEALSPLDIRSIFERVLHKPLQVKKTPALVMKIMGKILAPFNPPAASLLDLNYRSAYQNSIIDTAPLARQLGIRLIPAEEYLRSKLGRE